MVEKDVEVVGVDQPMLGRALEQVLRVGGQELVDRRRRADQCRQAGARPAAGSAHLLPGAGDGARIADADRRVETADVDPELERVGCHHPAHAAVAEPGLDRVPLVRQVAAAIAADGVRMAGRRLERLPQVGRQHLDRRARAREGDRLHPATDQPLRQALPGEERGAADAELLVGDRWVDDEDVLAARWGAVVVDQLDRGLQDALGQLARVGDGGAGADEDGIGAVVVADPAQAADDVRHVAAEQPTVGVELVDDHVLEVLEQLEPLRVVRKDRRVEHVGVGDHDLPGRADHAPHVGGRVAVVGVRLEADLGGAGQRAQLHQLVRRQRLGGEQVERAGRLVLCHRVDDRQVVAERLARCRRRHHHHVLPRVDGLVGCRLVRVERLDPAAAQRLDEPRVEPTRPRCVARRTRFELAVRGDQRRE